MKPLLLLLAPSMTAFLLACTAPTTAPPDKEPALPDIEPAPLSVAETTARWEAPTDKAFGMLASASANDEGAVAYAELEGLDGSGSFTRTRIKLQRLDSAGALRGPSIELGVVESDSLSGLALASDGSQYIGCWADDSQIACAAAPAFEGSASPGQSMAGAAPSLAYSAGTWALAYSVPGSLGVVRLASDGMAAGSPVMLEAGENAYFHPLSLLVATKFGFVLAGGNEVRAYALDFELSPIAKVNLGVMAWSFGAIAASETSVAIHLTKPYGSNLFLLQALPPTITTDTQPFAGGGKLGLRASLIAEGASFGMLTPEVDAYGYIGDDLFYRVIGEGGVPASERPQDVDFTVSEEDPRTLLRLKDDVLLASVPDRREVVVARIHRQ
jgi:hypothetical protein